MMWPLADLGRGVLDGQTTTAADVVVRLATELIFFWLGQVRGLLVE